MNSGHLRGNRGVSIKPSSRRSIHCHGTFCPFLLREMVRYGDYNDYNNKTLHRRGSSAPANRLESVDEVDNVLSKPHRSSSPLQRGSLNIIPQQYTDDSDEQDEFGDWPISQDHLISEHSNSSLESDNYSPNHSRKNNTRGSSDHELNKSQSVKPSRAQEQKKTKCKRILLVPLVAMLSVAAAFYSNILSAVQGSKSLASYDELAFHRDMTSLGKKYNINDNSILQLSSGISTIVKREDASSFIIVYNSKNKYFNAIHFYKFIDDVCFVSAKYLRNDSKSIHHLVVGYSDLDMETHGELISKYRDEVSKAGVMLVKELDKVPSALAMAFHYYCDEYNPLVKKSAILFTLDIAKCSDRIDDRSTYATIEKCLTSKWNTIPADNVKPLLTRVVNIVVDVSRDF